MKRTLQGLLQGLSLALVAFLTLSAVAGPAAQAAEKVLGMNVEGDKLAASDRQALFKTLQVELSRFPDITLLKPSSHELIDEMIELECVDVDLPCLSRLGAKYGADRLVYTQVDPVKGKKSYTLLVRIVDAKAGTMLRDQAVEVASMAGLAPALEAQVEAVWGKPPAAVGPAEVPPVADGTLIVEASVPTATIYVGADYAGTGSATVSKPPGKYSVRISAAGFDEQVMEVEVAAGETTTRSVQLVASVMKAPGEGEKKKEEVADDDGGSGWVLWAIIGGVVVAGAVTAIALAASSDDGPARGPVVLSTDPNNAWRDAAVTGGRP